LRVVFPQLLEKCQGITHNEEARAELSSGTEASPKCLIFAASLTLDMINLGSNPRKPYSQIYFQPYCLLSNCFQFFHTEVFNYDGNSLA